MKLDRLLAKYQSMGRSKARLAITAQRVMVNGCAAKRVDLEVDRFASVLMDGETVQEAVRLLHIMVNKSVGVLSATTDATFRTVVDLIDDADKASLHLVGRLDRSTSGLVLLTNDGRWSKTLMHPSRKIPKVYLVETRDPISSEAVEAFANGFYFHTEDLTTMPAKLEILAERSAKLTLHEGRYHQVKRMFHRTGNRVTALHRESIGAISLPADLQAGQWRSLTSEEVAAAQSGDC